MQVTWQNTYSSDVTGNGHLLCLHQFQFKHTACIHYVPCCGSCESSPKAVCYASGPATVKKSLCSATVAVTQPFSVLYERFHKIQQPSSCWQWCVSSLSGPYENDLKPHLTLATAQGQPHLIYIHPHTELTPCSRVLLEKLTGSQLAKKFPAFYGNWRLLTTFPRAHHLSPPWAISISITMINYHRHNSLSFHHNLQCTSHQLPSQLKIYKRHNTQQLSSLYGQCKLQQLFRFIAG